MLNHFEGFKTMFAFMVLIETLPMLKVVTLVSGRSNKCHDCGILPHWELGDASPFAGGLYLVSGIRKMLHHVVSYHTGSWEMLHHLLVAYI